MQSYSHQNSGPMAMSHKKKNNFGLVFLLSRKKLTTLVVIHWVPYFWKYINM